MNQAIAYSLLVRAWRGAGLEGQPCVRLSRDSMELLDPREHDIIIRIEGRAESGRPVRVVCPGVCDELHADPERTAYAAILALVGARINRAFAARAEGGAA